MAVEDVVAEDQGHPVGADEFGADDESIGQPARMLLDRVGEGEAESEPSPSRRSNRCWSCGVVMIRMSRTPASISVASG